MSIMTKEKRDNYVRTLKYKTKQMLEILEGRELKILVRELVKKKFGRIQVIWLF